MTIREYDVDDPLEVLDDPVRQWLDWEEQANLIGFRTSTEPVSVDVVAVPRDALRLDILPGAPPEIVERFVEGGEILVPRHPLNRDPSVAWFDAPVRERWTARFTSSRTLAFPGAESGEALFSLKLSTDHPHPDFFQPEKTKLREEADGAVEWVTRVTQIDALLGPPRELELIIEVIVALQVGGETGFMVRDLRSFQNGDYVLPALSLPFVGRQIARRHGRSFEEFFGHAYATLAGRAKARVMARYGLWYETPNPQNLLLRLDRRLAPTGRLVFRDVGDGYCATDALACPVGTPWTRLVTDLRLETTNSFWAFGEAGEHAIPEDVLGRWYALHDDAYYAELAGWFPAIAPPASLPAERRLDHWNAALRSDAGQEAIAAGFAARMAEHAQA